MVGSFRRNDRFYNHAHNHELDSVEKVTREFFVSPANSQDTSLITGMIRFDFYDYD